MLQSLPLLGLIAIFIVAAIAVWLSGIRLSNSTDILSDRFGLGQALGGMILLAVATNLPEIAITATAGVTHNIGIATGNILGGIAIQTVVLVILDAFGARKKDALSYLASSLELVLEGVLVIAVLVVAIMGTQLPQGIAFLRMSPSALLIVVIWVFGLWLLSKARKDLSWQVKKDRDGGDTQDVSAQNTKKQQKEKSTKQTSTGRALLTFIIASVITLVAGAALEFSGDAISKDIGLSGVLFGATILAAATSLPEVSTGLQSTWIADYEMAFSDIFGGNAFLPVLFILADLLSGQAVLPQAQKSDIYLASLGCLLTGIYIYGLIFRRPKQLFHRVGIDSVLVLGVYIVAIVGLIFMPGK
ncbi:sodium:calcium antiporter [Dictyobacter aurantiacus]|uniref:Sodium/calcium exchanger membrane protein n=1 Tax=Dictyobacter aurantiacus TaxID=1936993 RepID=A0A401Z8K8_9CHLR|nr:sodium:calcium antiporter [Dictyobacter aurantiacus]GCE03169.1 sodium/calcium exchanger membrane protein [Dictyobacter aurantiacus]